MQTLIHRAKDRGYAKHTWLETRHSFSFANYYDPARMGFGALRVINDDIIAPGMGFGEHPHKNMEIITIPLSGALAHRDSMGNQEVIQAGEIQVMSAGTGVEHSEFNASKTDPVTLLQIWIFPDTENITPRYEQKKFEKKDFTNKLQVFVGKIGTASLGIHQQAKLSLGYFDHDMELSYSQERDRGTYFFVIEGGLKIGENSLGKRDAIGVWEEVEINLKVQEKAFLLAIEVPMG